MVAFNPDDAISILNQHKTSLGSTGVELDKYLTEAIARLGGRASDDRREATKLAVETAKMILTISVGVLIAVGTFVQFAHTGGVPWISLTNVLFGFAVGVLLLSMTFGFNAISRAYKRADGREAATDPAWATEPLAWLLNKQASMGIAGLGFLILGLVTWPAVPYNSQSNISVTLSGKATSQLYAAPLLIDGKWSELRLKTNPGQEVQLPPKSGPIAIQCN